MFRKGNDFWNIGTPPSSQNLNKISHRNKCDLIVNELAIDIEDSETEEKENFSSKQLTTSWNPFLYILSPFS